MNRDQKVGMVENLHTRFRATPFVVLADFKGSTVAQMNAFRRACEPAGIYFRVVKNTLAVRALEGTGMEKLAEKFRGNVGLLISGDDAIGTAKLLRQQVKDNEKILVKAGYFDGDVLDSKGVANVAELPTKEEMQAKLLSVLVQGPTMLLSVIQAPARDLLFLLQNYASKLESEGRQD